MFGMYDDRTLYVHASQATSLADNVGYICTSMDSYRYLCGSIFL